MRICSAISVVLYIQFFFQFFLSVVDQASHLYPLVKTGAH